jgi:NDP-sugar pyrophosphorylase family protein
MIKKAMIMAAGVGSRLGQLSNIVPKPLVPIANVATMDILINHISNFGITDIISNTYYKAECLKEHYNNNNFNVNINFLQETELSGTAGGLKKCQYFFDEGQDFIVMSGDGLTDIDLNEAYKSHKNSNAMITIVAKEVSHLEVSKYGIIVTDKEGFVQSFQEKPSIENAKSNLANTGIYIFNYDIFKFIPENTFFDFAKNVFPEIMKSNIKINTYIHYGYWSDIGSIEQYKKSNEDVINKKINSIKTDIVETDFSKYVCGKNLKICESSRIEGNCIIGNNCTLGENSIIRNSILWDNVKIKDNVIVENSIILPNTIVEKSLYNEILEETQNDTIAV